MRRRRLRLGATLLAGLLAQAAVAGCGSGAGADPGPAEPRHYPAAAAGGACQLLDYDMIAEATAVRFNTAGASQREETYTCAVTQRDIAYPDLILSVTATKADEVVFAAAVTPSGATTVKDLGKVGYQLKVAAAGGHGARWEIGWLSGNQRLMVLRFTFPPGRPAAEVDGFGAKLLDLARKIDLTSV